MYCLTFQDTAASLLTPSKKKVKNIAIYLNEDDDEDEEDDEKENEPTQEPIVGRGKRTAVLDSKLRVNYVYVLLYFYVLKYLYRHCFLDGLFK